METVFIPTCWTADLCAHEIEITEDTVGRFRYRCKKCGEESLLTTTAYLGSDSMGDNIIYLRDGQIYGGDPMNKGWECPKCGRVHAPRVAGCDCHEEAVRIPSCWTEDALLNRCEHDYEIWTDTGGIYHQRCRKCGEEYTAATPSITVDGSTSSDYVVYVIDGKMYDSNGKEIIVSWTEVET